MTFKGFNPFTDERKKWIFLWILLLVFVSLPISHWMRTTFKIHASCFLSSKDKVTYQEIGILYLKQMNMLSGEETETTFHVKLAQGERRGTLLYAEPPFAHGFLANYVGKWRYPSYHPASVYGEQLIFEDRDRGEVYDLNMVRYEISKESVSQLQGKTFRTGGIDPEMWGSEEFALRVAELFRSHNGRLTEYRYNDRPMRIR